MSLGQWAVSLATFRGCPTTLHVSWCVDSYQGTALCAGCGLHTVLLRFYLFEKQRKTELFCPQVPAVAGPGPGPGLSRARLELAAGSSVWVSPVGGRNPVTRAVAAACGAWSQESWDSGSRCVWAERHGAP